MIAGRLEIELAANVARLSQDMSQAKGMVGSAMADISRSVAQAKSVLGSLGIGLGIGAFAALIKGTIDAMDHLNDLSKSTGLASDTLAGLRFAAKQTGSELDGTAASINKLSQNIGKDAEKFRALGISAKDPLEAFKQLADVFVAIEDPQQRAALGAAALGKGWQSAAPLLAEGGAQIGRMVEEGAKLSGITQQMTRDADEFNDKLVQLAGNGGVVNRIVGDALPLLNAAADGLLQFRGGSEKASEGLNPLAEVLRVVIVLFGNLSFVLKGIGNELGGIAAQLTALVTGDFKRFAEIGKMMKADAEANRTAFDKWEAGIMAVGTAAKTANVHLDTTDQISRRLASDTAGRVREFLAGEEAKKKAAKDAADAARAHAKALREEWDFAFEDLKDQLKELKDAYAELDKMEKQFGKTINKITHDLEDDAAGAVDKAVDAGMKVHDELSKPWMQFGDMLGDLFAEILFNGKNAFDGLKRMAKQLLAEMIALFAKRWILNLVAGGGLLGSAGQALAGGAGQLGGGSMAGGLLGGAGSAAMAWGGEFAAGAAGTFMGPTTTFSAAGMGASMSGVYSALAAIPVWGWIAMAVVAIGAWIAGKHKGGDKFGGSFFSGGSVPGTDNGRFFTPNQGDAEMRKLVDATSAGFMDTLARLGGSGGAGFNFGLGFDHDPRGTAQSRVSSMLTGPDGRPIYSAMDVSMDDKDVPAALQLESQRMILAALQASDLPPAVAEILNSIVASTAGIEEIQGVINLAVEMKGILEGLAAIDMTGFDIEALKEFQRAGEAIGDTYRRVVGQFNAFEEAFMTEAQKIDRASAAIVTAFAAMGVAIPASKWAFYDLVKGLDLSTAAGRTLFEQLMAIAPAFAFVADSGDGSLGEFDDSVQEATTSVGNFSHQLRETMDSARVSMGDFLNSLLTDSNLSPLNLQQRYDAAKKAYDMATSGPLSMISPEQLQAAQEAARMLLDLSLELHGGKGSTGYTADFQSIYETLGKVGTGERPFAEAFASALPSNGQLASGGDIEGLSRATNRGFQALATAVQELIEQNREDSAKLRSAVRESPQLTGK